MLNFLIPPTHPRTLVAGGRDGQLGEGLLGWGSWSLPVPPFHFLSAPMHLVSLTMFVPTLHLFPLLVVGSCTGVEVLVHEGGGGGAADRYPNKTREKKNAGLFRFPRFYIKGTQA
jgi:hypothetical protein